VRASTLRSRAPRVVPYVASAGGGSAGQCIQCPCGRARAWRGVEEARERGWGRVWARDAGGVATGAFAWRCPDHVVTPAPAPLAPMPPHVAVMSIALRASWKDTSRIITWHDRVLRGDAAGVALAAAGEARSERRLAGKLASEAQAAARRASLLGQVLESRTVVGIADVLGMAYTNDLPELLALFQGPAEVDVARVHTVASGLLGSELGAAAEHARAVLAAALFDEVAIVAARAALLAVFGTRLRD
jgi:hypothetical protein